MPLNKETKPNQWKDRQKMQTINGTHIFYLDLNIPRKGQSAGSLFEVSQIWQIFDIFAVSTISFLYLIILSMVLNEGHFTSDTISTPNLSLQVPGMTYILLNILSEKQFEI